MNKLFFQFTCRSLVEPTSTFRSFPVHLVTCWRIQLLMSMKNPGSFSVSVHYRQTLTSGTVMAKRFFLMLVYMTSCDQWSDQLTLIGKSVGCGGKYKSGFRTLHSSLSCRVLPVHVLTYPTLLWGDLCHCVQSCISEWAMHLQQGRFVIQMLHVWVGKCFMNFFHWRDTMDLFFRCFVWRLH